MITAPAPTRAQLNDAANAVFDGTDALMLSGKTAIGRDPAHVVRTMARIAARAEQFDADRIGDDELTRDHAVEQEQPEILAARGANPRDLPDAHAQPLGVHDRTAA